MKFEDRTGQKFGKWTALSYAGKSSWNCQCECGIKRTVKTQAILSGASRSCKGCGRRRHGLSGKTEDTIWKGIKRRCLNPKDPHFHRYGGRGIKVSERWLNGEDGKTGFECFVLDMGRRPSLDVSIDRIDNDGDYEPSNCRWATVFEQSENRATTRHFEYRGQNVSVSEAARMAGGIVDGNTAKSRVERGWPVKRAVETPYLRSQYTRSPNRSRV